MVDGPSSTRSRRRAPNFDGRKAVIDDTSALRPVPRHGAVLAAVKIAPFGDRLSLVRELDDPRVPGRVYPGL